MQQNKDPKHTASTRKDFNRGKLGQFQTGQINNLNSIEHTFHLLKKGMREETARNKYKMKKAVLNFWKSGTNEESNVNVPQGFLQLLKASFKPPNIKCYLL